MLEALPAALTQGMWPDTAWSSSQHLFRKQCTVTGTLGCQLAAAIWLPGIICAAQLTCHQRCGPQPGQAGRWTWCRWTDRPDTHTVNGRHGSM